MTDESTTRRRVIQSAGLIGVTGIVGSSVVTAQETPTEEGSPTGTPDGDTALRVTHASPDAPAVDVRLDDQTVVEGLSFGTVTDYQTVDPGSYQLQILAAGDGEGFLGGLLDDLFGSNEQGDTVLYDQEVTVEEGTAYTAVAFGEARQGSASTPAGGEATPDGGTPTETPVVQESTPDGETPTETPVVQDLQMGGGGQAGPLVEGLAFGESASATVPSGDYRLLIRPDDDEAATPTEDGATPTDGETPTEDQGAFQVALLEDDLSSPPDGQSRVRVFHAVPDLDDVSIVAVPQGQGQGGGQGQGQGQGQGGGQGQGQGPPISADVSLAAGTVYSAFAVGYADPEAAAEETPTDGETTPEAGTPTDVELPAFELVVAETATDGDRVQGNGTN